MSTETLTREEALDEYGDAEVRFAGYYKYRFTYEGETEDGKELVASAGGDHNQIYRYSVGPGPQPLSETGFDTLKVDGELIHRPPRVW